jgi:hypothetical protein
MMKNVAIVGFVLAAILPAFLGGCRPAAAVGGLGLDSARQTVWGHNWQDQVTDTKSERWARYNLIRDIEDRQFQDDFDTIFLLDRNSYLSQWHAGVRR